MGLLSTSYMTGYTFGNGRRRFTARLAVCRVFTTARRTGRMPRRGRWLLFVVIGEARTSQVSAFQQPPLASGASNLERI